MSTAQLPSFLSTGMAGSAIADLNLQAPPHRLSHHGFVWDHTDAEGLVAFSKCWFWRATRPTSCQIETLVLPESGLGLICFEDGSHTQFGAIPGIGSVPAIIRAHTPHWVIPDLSVPAPLICTMVTERRIAAFDHLAGSNVDEGEASTTWLQSLRTHHPKRSHAEAIKLSADATAALSEQMLIGNLTSLRTKGMPANGTIRTPAFRNWWISHQPVTPRVSRR